MTTATSQAAAGQGGSREARRLAAAILEVLAGLRGTTEAAAALGISLVRYYQLETLALRGLIAACEPRPRGRVVSPASKLAALQKELLKSKRELARQLALVRLSQRAVGLPPPQAKPPGKSKTRTRRPTLRALRVAEQLLAQDNEPGGADQATPATDG